MKSDFLEFIGNARKRRGEKFRNQLYIFIICLILSVFFWTLVKLSKDYYYTVDYQLNYTRIPANYRLIHYSDSILALKIKVQGFDFFTERFFRNDDRQYEVSLKNIKVRYKDSRIWGYLLTNPIGKEIAAQANFPSEVHFISPDTLFFEFERRYPKGSNQPER